jgi:hypothetical protein
MARIEVQPTGGLTAYLAVVTVGSEVLFKARQYRWADAYQAAVQFCQRQGLNVEHGRGQ